MKYTKKQLIERLARREKELAVLRVRYADLERRVAEQQEFLLKVVGDRTQESQWAASGRCVGDGGSCPRTPRN